MPDASPLRLQAAGRRLQAAAKRHKELWRHSGRSRGTLLEQQLLARKDASLRRQMKHLHGNLALLAIVSCSARGSRTFNYGIRRIYREVLRAGHIVMDDVRLGLFGWSLRTQCACAILDLKYSCVSRRT